MISRTDRDALIVSFAYVVMTTAWFYLDPHAPSEASAEVLLVAVLLIQFALRFSLARWWALLLPLFVVVFSVPLADGSDAPGW